jgi:hypothetical protein
MTASAGSTTILVLGGGYLTLGAVLAVALARRGHAAATVVSAVVAWPLLIPLVQVSPRPAATAGPMARRIEQTFTALQLTLSDPAASEVPWHEDVEGLREALLRGDQRLGLADRLLSETGTMPAADVELSRSLDHLRDARDRAAEEIEAVLSGVTQLRIQVGLETLAGDAVPVLERLREFRARVRALEEVAGMDEVVRRRASP